MKKTLVFLMILIITLTLTGCVEITYEGVYDSYQSYLDDNNDDYDQLMSFYNELNTEWIKGTITVKSIITELDFSSVGTGFIYAEDEDYYYALTNSHVIGGGIYYQHIIHALDLTGLSYDATLIAYDTDYDLAAIKFLKGDNDLLYIPFAEHSPEYRDYVSVLGHPDGQVNGLMIGYYLDMTTLSLSAQSIGTVDFSVLKLTVPVQPGSSGSVVMNMNYEAVGVLFAGSYGDETDIFTTYSFAIPVEKVKEFLDDQTLEAGDLS